MSKKIKTLTLALGLAATLGVAAVPLTTYADQAEYDATLDINVDISTVISMTLTSGTMSTSEPYECTSSPSSTDVSSTLLPGADDTTKCTTIYVTTNSPDGYVLTLADADSDANLETTEGYTIAPISSQPVGSTNPGWAVSIDSGTNWLAMPASTATAITVKSYVPNPKAVVTDDASTVYYGFATASDQATGTYTDKVTYTATGTS